jgi:hypothetical protein
MHNHQTKLNRRYLDKRKQVGERLPGAGVRAEHDASAIQHGGNADALDLGGLRDAHLPQRGHHLLPEPQLLEVLRGLSPPPLLQVLGGPVPSLRLLSRRLRRAGRRILKVAHAEALEEELVPRRGRRSGGGERGGGSG